MCVPLSCLILVILFVLFIYYRSNFIPEDSVKSFAEPEKWLTKKIIRITFYCGIFFFNLGTEP